MLYSSTLAHNLALKIRGKTASLPYSRNTVLYKKATMEPENDTLDKEVSAAQHTEYPGKRKLADGKVTSEIKRLKWETKQARKEAAVSKNRARERWFDEHSSFCTRFCFEDVHQSKLGDPDPLAKLLAPYMDLKDGPKKNVEGENLFIAEGTETVRVLLQKSATHGIKIKSILVKPATLFDPPVNLLSDIDLFRAQHNDEIPFQVLMGDDQALSAIVGFPIARGAVACGVVPPGRQDQTVLEAYLASKPNSQLLALDGICDIANMGSMIRCAAAFGMDAIVLSQDCCDPWYRRSVRVSMGHVFHIKIFRVNDMAATMKMLGRRNIVSYAAVIDPDAELILEMLSKGDVPNSWCCVVGNEGNGISKKVVDACSVRLRIGMADGVDSLSVPIATGILLHGLRERAKQHRNDDETAKIKK
jgi:tRNA G18 (ribose-2'-O)-methylase SpoU